MNTTTKLVSLGALALFYACSQQGPTTETKPGDVTPKSLVARPTPPQLPSQDLIRFASPSSPRDAITLPAAPMLSSHHDASLKVAAGSSPASHVLRVDAPEGGTLFLSGSSQPDDAILADVKVIAPDGTVLNVRAPKPAMVDGSSPPAQRPMSAIDLSGHPAGTYTIVTGSVAAQGGLAAFAVQPNATLVMQLQPSVSHFLLGDDATVEARLTDGDAPVSGAVLEGQLFAPDDSAQALKFVDMGGGKYRAWISPSLGATDQTGTYNVTVHATGTTASGTAFARDGITALGYGIPTARINEVSATRTVFDAAGNVSNLEADVTVEAVSTDGSGSMATRA